MRQLRIPAKDFERGPWTDRYGHRHPARMVHRESYLAPDKGAPGRTPMARRFFTKKVHMGWHKDMPQEERRALALEAHLKAQRGRKNMKKALLSTARALQQLANVNTDFETKRQARGDALYFLRRYHQAR